MEINPPVIISFLGMLITAISVVSALYFSSKNSKSTDVKEIERRVEERTETNMKLDEIGRNVNDIKFDISSTKKEVYSLTERVASVEASFKAAHQRIDKIEKEMEDHDKEA